MPRPRNTLPTYKPNTRTGQARVYFPGGGERMLPGAFGSPESLAAYERLLAEWRVAGGVVAVPKPDEGLTVAAAVAAFQAHANATCSVRGGEAVQFRHALQPVLDLYGLTPAAEFRCRALGAVRQVMVEKGWCRRTVNRHVVRVRTCWRWLESQELVPPGSYEHLRSLRGLDKRSGVRQPPPRRPVEWSRVEATLPALPPAVAAMVRVQWYTGMRSGEVRLMRACDLDRVSWAGVWLYMPMEHKSDWREEDDGPPGRVVAVGPAAQEVIGPWLAACARPDDFLFPPKSRSGGRGPAGKCYRKDSYSQTVRKACLKAGVDPWHPYQLRHACKRRVEQQFRTEDARAVLGQKHVDTTQLYGGLDVGLAAEVMRRIG